MITELEKTATPYVLMAFPGSGYVLTGGAVAPTEGSLLLAGEATLVTPEV